MTTTTTTTPLECHGDVWVKRDDLFTYGGQAGGKVRTCLALSAGAVGLVTASARTSPQQLIVATIAREAGIPARLHVPASRAASSTLAAARDAGAEVVEHRPGYNTVLCARARVDAEDRGWTYIPFGMEHAEAVRQTSAQVPAALPDDVRRVVVPVGSGMSLAGILTGLVDAGHAVPVLGVVVGADPTRRLDRYAPPLWRQMVDLVPAGMDYHAAYPDPVLRRGGLDVPLDPWYEAKVLPHLRAGDLLWVVGNRGKL